MNVWLKRLLYLLGLFLLIGAMMLITMPVQFMVLQWGVPASVRIGTVAGTLQSGKVSNFTYDRKLEMVDLRKFPVDILWEWCPSLSQGVLAWCVQVESSSLRGEGDVSYALLADEYRFSDTSVDLQLQNYPLNFGGMQSRLKGRGSFRLKELSLASNGVPLRALVANGKLEQIGTSEFELGDYLWRANLGSDDTLRFDFSGGGGDFSIKGKASLGVEKKTYSYDADIVTDNDHLFAFLKNRASKSKNNTLSFSQSGKF